MFKRDLTLYVETLTGYYKVPVYPDVSYSQVYTEQNLPLKTLHNPENLISDGFTDTLNIGNLNFTIPIVDSALLSEFLSRLFKNEPEEFVTYLEIDGHTLKFNNCITTSLTFNFQKNAIITLSVEAEYSHSVEGAILPSFAQSFGNIYSYIQGIEILVDDVEFTNINNFNIEVKNSISWLDNSTMHDAGPVYRTENYTSEKVISGNIIKYDEISNPIFSDSSRMSVQINFGGSEFLLFELDSIIITGRQQLDDLVKMGFDFRAISQNNTIKHRGVEIL